MSNQEVNSSNTTIGNFLFIYEHGLYLNPLVSAIIPRLISINASVCP